MCTNQTRTPKHKPGFLRTCAHGPEVQSNFWVVVLKPAAFSEIVFKTLLWFKNLIQNNHHCVFRGSTKLIKLSEMLTHWTPVAGRVQRFWQQSSTKWNSKLGTAKESSITEKHRAAHPNCDCISRRHWSLRHSIGSEKRVWCLGDEFLTWVSVIDIYMGSENSKFQTPWRKQRNRVRKMSSCTWAPLPANVRKHSFGKWR